MTGPVLEVTRSYTRHIVIADVTSMLGLKWRLEPKAAHDLIGQLSEASVRQQPVCRGTVATVDGPRVTFEWPLARVDHAIADLRHHLGALIEAR